MYYGCGRSCGAAVSGIRVRVRARAMACHHGQHGVPLQHDACN